MSNQDTGRILFIGDYINPDEPWWARFSETPASAANLIVSTLTVNSYPAGNILLTSQISSGTEYNAPLIFQRPSADVNAPSESLVMNLSHLVPTKTVDGEFITATKDSGTVYDDIAVSGLQLFGDQTTSGNAGCIGYITSGPSGSLSIEASGVYISSLYVSSLTAEKVVSTTTGSANSYTASLFMSTPILYADNVSTTVVAADSVVAKNDIYSPALFIVDSTGTPEYGTIGYDGNCNVSIFSQSGIALYTTVLTDPILLAKEDYTAQFFSTVQAPIFTGPSSIISTMYSTDIFASTLHVSSLNISSFAASTITTDFLNVELANVSSMVVSSIGVGNLQVTEVDTKTISSLTGNISFNLISTLQLKADIAISPNINLGLGSVIQGLIGGAATQALGVGIGSAGLVTGAVAMITGRTSGGANPTVFQTVNGSTQLQFSTIGIPTLSVFLNTDATDPLHSPGNLTNVTTLVPAGTYCVRSVGDPLNVDSSTQAIQMFGQWVPVIHPTATFSQMAISTLNVSTMQTSVAAISSLTVSTLNAASFPVPNLLLASSINVTGQVQGLNPQALFSWVGETHIPNAVTSRLRFWDNFNTLEGEIYATTQPNTGLTVVASNGMRIQNAETPLIPTIGFNSNSTVDIYSTLRVESLQNYGVAYISTLNVSSLNASIQSIIPSTLNVSTVNAVGNIIISTGSLNTPYASISTLNVSTLNGGGGGNYQIPSTLYLSSVNVNGLFTTPDVYLIDSESYLSTGRILGGKRTNGTNGVNIYSGVDGNISLHAGVIGTPGITFNYQNSLLPPTESLFGSFEPQGGGPGGTDPQLFLNCELRSPYNNIFGESLTSFTTQFLETDTDSKVGYMTGGRRGAGTQGLNIFSGEGNTITIADQLAPNGQDALNTIASFQYQNIFPQGAQTTLNNKVNITNQLTVDSNITTDTLNVTTLVTTLRINTTYLQAFGGDITNISTTNIKATGTAAINNLSTTNILATDVSTITLNSEQKITTASLFVPTISSVTTINGIPWPLPTAVPLGAVMIWAGGNSSDPALPTGWLLCDGQGAYTAGVYNPLFKVIGHSYDNPAYPYDDNIFYLPDLTFAVPMGAPTVSYYPRASVYSVASFPNLIANPNQIWYINTKQTGNRPVVINTQFSVGLYTLYVSAILSGGGQDGYCLMQNVDNTNIYPVVGVSDPAAPIQITAIGYYNPDLLPYRRPAYEIGSYNDDGGTSSRVSHNQTQLEVGPHTHLGVPDKASSAIVGSGYSVGNGGSTGWPQESYVNPRLPTGDTAFHQNYGTKTAGNFLNMFYIIRALP